MMLPFAWLGWHKRLERPQFEWLERLQFERCERLQFESGVEASVRVLQGAVVQVARVAAG